MAYTILDKDLEATDENGGKKWIRPMQLGSGWAAVMMWINNQDFIDTDMDNFPEPWDTHFNRFATKEEAVEACKQWGQAEEVPVFLDLN